MTDTKKDADNLGWFCWERGTSGKWTPCVYYLEKPKETNDRVNIQTLINEDLNCANEPMFGKLSAKYPRPVYKSETYTHKPRIEDIV